MDSIKLWGRNGEAVGTLIELGNFIHLETASEESADAFLLFAVDCGLSNQETEAFPDPRYGLRLTPGIGISIIDTEMA